MKFTTRHALHALLATPAPSRAKRNTHKPRPAPRSLAGIDLPAGQRVVCHYPPVALNPNNSHAHWSRRTGSKKRYEQDCWVLALQARLKVAPEGPIFIQLDFFPPDRSKRDDDNAEASFKAGRDGIARAMGVDDSRFVISRRMRSEPLSCVVFTILERAPE
jgi:crossover junction endodeoxyribonuclease RusA